MDKEERSWFHHMSAKAVGGTVGGVLAAVIVSGLGLRTLAPKWFTAIVGFFAEPRYLPTWGFVLIGFSFIALLLWGLFQKLEKEYDRIAYVPIHLLSEIQKKGKYSDLLKGRIRVHEGRVYYGDIFRRHQLVEEFKDFKIPERVPRQLPTLP